MNRFVDDKAIRHLLDKMDRLREVLGSSGATGTIPSVIVVGAQSHGKSTVIEMICGVKLPSGTGMVSKIHQNIHILQLTLCAVPLLGHETSIEPRDENYEGLHCHYFQD
jgi:ABC-type transport system involved in cytochrome c biogenesis ATPase subunit